MTEDPTGFRACYKHPTRPATHTCLGCERPICGRCAEESGDIRFCRQCAIEDEDRPDFSAAPAINKLQFEREAKRVDLDVVGEVTIFSDGSVDAPGQEKQESAQERDEAEDSGSGSPGSGSAEAVRAQAVRDEAEPESARPRVKIPLPSEERTIRRPERQRPERHAEQKNVRERGRTAQPEAAASHKEQPGDEEPLEPVRRRPEPKPKKRRMRSAGARLAEGWAALKGWASDQRYEARPLWQLFAGFWFALGCASAVMVLWLAVALFFHRWSQMSVLIVGMVTPWLFYKRAGWHKTDGTREKVQPPAAIWVSTLSLVIAVGVSIAMQVLAYLFIYNPNPHKLPFSDFMARFFTPIDWGIILVGLAASFLIPFLLEGDTNRSWNVAPGKHVKDEEKEKSEEDKSEEDEEESASEESVPRESATGTGAVQE